MLRFQIVMALIFILLVQNSCSFASNYPQGKISITVLDEEGNPIEKAQVRIGFEQYVNEKYKGIPIGGQSNSVGKFSGEAHGTQAVSYGASKEGYYNSHSEYYFKEKKMGRWEPWNPELKIVLRKIEKPVPMYARDTHLSPLEIPVAGKKIGFDLVVYDWVLPYGKGEHSDFIFKLDREFVSDMEFTSFLTITFSDKFDGIQVINEDRLTGSQFKLLRYAPEAGYEKKLTQKLKRVLGKPMEDRSGKNRNYIFRIRSEEKDGKLIRAMYGKVLGDIEFDPRGSNTAKIFIKYYLNPAYTRNLEFDPNRNLFNNLKSTEQVGIE